MTTSHEEHPLLCTRWKRISGREIVRIRRIWNYGDEGLSVRAHPEHGGRPLIAPLDWFVEHYANVGLAMTEGQRFDAVERYTAEDLATYKFLEVTATRAVCDAATFDRLHEYSSSMPTGVCDGKVWKRRKGDGWYLGEYVDEGKPNRVRVIWRLLVVAQAVSDD